MVQIAGKQAGNVAASQKSDIIITPDGSRCRETSRQQEQQPKVRHHLVSLPKGEVAEAPGHASHQS